MAGESQESTELTVSLPPDLESWLDQHAAERDLERETLLVQLLASYRELAQRDGEVFDPNALEPVVRSVVGDRLPEIAEAVDGQLEDTDRLEERVTDLEADFQDKIDDVRQRVIQVKREADAKAPADHTHDRLRTLVDRLDALESRVERVDSELDRIGDLESELGRLDELRTELDRLDDFEAELSGVESQLADLRGQLENTVRSDEVSDLAEDLADAREKLQTVAWVVRDLRERGGGTTVEAIKRKAGEHDVRRARCESCGEGVEIGLLTEPSCPHCSAALDGFEPSNRILGLGSATLTVASQIGPGAEETGDAVDGIDTGGEQP
ncbi:hypothetical protein [Halapricum hydrolyticum]|uniref:CopG family transcriptional regulator n=1 Tax=Halapricum hydrolyticum TaxID=2979991 RepID=A0AAE3ID52_9EURY|nr:hypothetical protein [Halapricum hydrolyticum]MCU4719520.1 hypothetical protein [Halapricum hydrolyticum]MCU4728196.1 hypothetical protein [Halapricum hydrolyticum]